jgi:hypothetical protein
LPSDFSSLRIACLALVAGCGAGCSGRGSPDPGFSPEEGTLVAKPGGGFFIADPHFGGRATRVRLLEVGWGRLVDVHDVDAEGRPSATPVLRDVVVGEDVLSDGETRTLETHPVTHETRLILHKTQGVDDGSGLTFEELLLRATSTLAPLRPKHDDGSASLPVSLVARNGALLLRFDDLLADGPELERVIFEVVRLRTGYPPTTPAAVRTLFDPVHGGLSEGEFHSTRILVDLAVSEREAAELPYFVPAGPAGLPASSTITDQPNVSLHLVTRLDPANGRMLALTNLAGRPLVPEGPTEESTQDLVRAWRSGNPDDLNGGFLLDLAQPSVVGSFALELANAREDPAGPAGFAFVTDAVFATPCRFAPRAGDALELGGELYELSASAEAPDGEGRVLDLRLTRLATTRLDDAASLLGLGRLLAPYRDEAQVPPACWLGFIPPPRDPPTRGISSDAEIVVRFSEPMDPATFRAFDSFRLLRGAIPVDPRVTATDIVVGEVRAAASLQEFRFRPRLPLDNVGQAEYRFELGAALDGVRDLTGSALGDAFELAEFTLDRDEPQQKNAGFALRFEEADELSPPGFADLRGQVTYDLGAGGVLRPRAADFASYTADRHVPLLSITGFWPLGVQTPLSPLGSKVQMLWRYADFNWRVRDERFHNLDVIGMYWAPLSGRLVSDYFPQFELSLGHSIWLPDEAPQANGAPRYPFSGLPGAGKYEDNYLGGPRGGRAVVHPRGLGYRVRPADLATAASGTPILPFPWNRSGAAETSYTWRDTAIRAQGDPRGAGVPMDIEVGDPLRLDTGIGEYYPPGEVASVGLPLLWEVRCYPNAAGLGFNSLDILLVFPGWSTPNCRVFSTGGIDSSGARIEKDPDLEFFPSGGFNPLSSPPGAPTPLVADNSFYMGQIDTVVRLSRAVTIWIDTGTTDPHYVEPVLEPRQQPDGTSVLPEFRGAHDFSPDALDAPFDAARLDPYGDFRPGTVTHLADGEWSTDIRAANGARFLQVRFTFVNNVEVGLTAELDSFGVAYERGF